MKPSYHTLNLVILSIILLGGVVLFSCNKSTTTAKCAICYNGGICDHDTCRCASGYEGANCQTISRDKFLGQFAVTEKGTGSLTSQYSLTIQADNNNLDNVIIQNCYNYFTTVHASVNHDTLFIPLQTIQGKLILGIGYILSSTANGSNGLITMKYEIVDTATQEINDFGYNSNDKSMPSLWAK